MLTWGAFKPLPEECIFMNIVIDFVKELIGVGQTAIEGPMEINDRGWLRQVAEVIGRLDGHRFIF